ncbi:hypothetical protein JJQ59_27865 [Cupriavidus necator]|uniref:Uncharacterized protein n=1 Tax=Cupriavidus necator TaxID=106590 RepID=A0A367PFY3_CUPNE|nr:hypothetical protein [Cupriavidus necator]QQX86591.1 hypothetical protein JJQ59_27865 [Cupriavidus necator]RCJ06788.1 hypothetical protein DDK22_19225 [Cupriavidus necator]
MKLFFFARMLILAGRLPPSHEEMAIIMSSAYSNQVFVPSSKALLNIHMLNQLVGGGALRRTGRFSIAAFP